jgi:hypothetical protein
MSEELLRPMRVNSSRAPMVISCRSSAKGFFLRSLAGKINEYRIYRLEECKALRGKPPAHNTMHEEIVTLRLIFKTALRHGWIDHLPDMSAPSGQTISEIEARGKRGVRFLQENYLLLDSRIKTRYICARSATTGSFPSIWQVNGKVSR